MTASIAFSRIYVQKLKNPTPLDSGNTEALEKWVAEVNSSYSQKSTETQFDKSVYLPTPEKHQPTFARNENKTKNLPSLENKSEPKEKKPISLRDLNAATIQELQVVRGIGPSFSKRIVKFRDLLGGFHSEEQLKEVYGLPEETVDELAKHFVVQSQPKAISINSDSAKVLAAHPYISYDLAWIIINYRKQNGDIRSSEDLRKIKALDEETFIKLKPYLD